MVEVGSRLGRGEWEKESFVSPWRRRREEQTKMTRWKAKLGDPEDDDPTVELYTAHWKQKENCEGVEDMMNLEHEQEAQVLSTADQGDQIEEVEESGEDWGDEVEAYSRRGGLGVRYSRVLRNRVLGFLLGLHCCWQA